MNMRDKMPSPGSNKIKINKFNIKCPCCTSPVDLTACTDLLFPLLDDPLGWRLRAVERLDLSSALWVDRQRAVHAEPLRPFLKLDPSLGNKAKIILPIVSFPKNARIDLHVEVDGKTAFLISREQRAELKAFQLWHLAEKVALGRGRSLGDLIDANLWAFLVHIFKFVPYRWDKVALDGNYAPANRVSLILKYLQSTTKRPRLTEADIAHWSPDLDRIGELVRASGPSSRLSAAESPVLALATIPTVRPDYFGTLIHRLRTFLDEAERVATSPSPSRVHAQKIIQRYIDYGLYWIAMAECIVPLDEPFMINLCERRVLQFSTEILPKEGVPDSIEKPNPLRRNPLRSILGYPTTTSHLIVFRDAKANHLNVRIADSSIELKEAAWDVREDPHSGKGVTSEQGESLHPNETADDIIDNAELFSFYSSDPKRSKRLWFFFPLVQTWQRRVTLYAVLGTLALSVLVMMTVTFLEIAGFCTSGFQKYISAILIPASFAGTILLVRPNSTLGAWVNGRSHFAVAILLILLFLWSVGAAVALSL